MGEIGRGLFMLGVVCCKKWSGGCWVILKYRETYVYNSKIRLDGVKKHKIKR